MKNWIWIIVAVGVALVLKHFLIGRAPKDATQASLSAGALVVDVRSAAEFAAGHYEGAVNIPLDQLSDRLGELGAKERAIVLYCHSGARSAAAKRLLAQSGFTGLLNAGGLHQMPKPRN